MLRLVVLPVVATLDSEISMCLQSHCDPLGLPCQTSGIIIATVIMEAFFLNTFSLNLTE